MPPIFKALIVVLVVSIAVLAFFWKPLTNQYGKKRMTRWAILWLGITACAFVLNNFWIYCFVAGAFIIFFSRSEPVKPAIYALLLATTPPLSFPIPGFAGINKLIEISPQLVIVFAIFLPVMLFSKHMKKLTSQGTTTDLFVFLWIVLQALLALRAPTATHALRTAIEAFLAVAPLYYVFSRYPKSLEDIRVISGAFVLSATILSATAIFEFGMNWHFYNHISTVWQAEIPHGYKLRDGLLRASTSTHNSIAWGFMAMCGLGLAIAVFNDRFPKMYRTIGLIILSIGLVLSLSRGPWVGAMAIVIVFVMTSQRAATRMSQLAIGGMGVFIVSLATPFGQRILDLLPFVGGSESGTISYRQELLKAAWQVAMENPFLGSVDYMTHPKLEAMRQGEGIIDIVNTYVQVLLASGFIGVFIFSSVFITALLSLRRAMIFARVHNTTLAMYCQAYMATLTGVMLTIFTTSSIPPIPLIYWMLIGGAVALTRIEEFERQNQSQAQDIHSPAASSASTTKQPAFDWK